MGTAAVAASAAAGVAHNTRRDRGNRGRAHRRGGATTYEQDNDGGRSVINQHDDLLQSMLRQITENTRVQQETAVLVKGLAVRVDSLEESRKRDEDRRDRRQENAPEGVRGWMIVTISVVAVAISACSLLSVAATVLPHLALH